MNIPALNEALKPLAMDIVESGCQCAMATARRGDEITGVTVMVIGPHAVAFRERAEAIFKELGMKLHKTN
jgi:hypothetical protein